MTNHEIKTLCEETGKIAADVQLGLKGLVDHVNKLEQRQVELETALRKAQEVLRSQQAVNLELEASIKALSRPA